MSYQIGIDTIRLRPTSRVAHTEYCDHEPLCRLVGDFNNAWELDLLWSTDDGPVPWSSRGRTTDMGHAEFMEHGSDFRPARPCPFADVEQVWQFDAVEEYGLPDSDDLVAHFEQRYQSAQKLHPNQVNTGGYYKTIMSGAIEALGWDMLLQAATDEAQFERVLDSIFRLSLHHFRAWARTSAEVFICHDDMVWSSGPFLAPGFYRRVIFPRYAELWQVLHQAGKKVLYCSDGDFTVFVDDIVAAGADGLIFEPLTSLDKVVGKYGQSHVVVGSKVDCRTLTFGTRQQIEAEIDATLQLAAKCPGFMFAVGNHIPGNIPLENAMFYFDYLRRNWQR